MTIDDFKKNVPLGPYTSLRIGGLAEYFFEAKDKESFFDALVCARHSDVPITILGGGQNVLISDKGIRGLVIVMRIKDVVVDGEKIYAGAGITVGELLAKTAALGFSGLEWAGGLPGTLGGAIYGNAGTFGHAVGELVESVDVVLPDGTQEKLSQQDCAFAYRASVFKSLRRDNIIVGAMLRFTKGDPKTIQGALRERIQWRTLHHPPYHSAGCMFKNPAEEHYHRVSFDASATQGTAQPVDWFGRVPAGWLIDRAGCKGLRVGGAVVSLVHANFLMNEGTATAEDLVMLMSIIKERVHRKFGVLLQEEVRYLGFR